MKLCRPTRVADLRTPARCLAGLLLALAALGVSTAPAARPEAGRHAAVLCVATAGGPPSCGPAQADLGRDGALRLRIDDVVYHLQLHSSQVEVVLMHGAMQIDEFTVPYEWVGSALQFSDDERSARYQIRFAEPKRRR